MDRAFKHTRERLFERYGGFSLDEETWIEWHKEIAEGKIFVTRKTRTGGYVGLVKGFHIVTFKDIHIYVYVWNNVIRTALPPSDDERWERRIRHGWDPWDPKSAERVAATHNYFSHEMSRWADDGGSLSMNETKKIKRLKDKETPP